MPGPRDAVSRALLLIAAVFVGGTVGYRLIEGSTWWDAFFMTVITITTVGYSEEIPLSEVGEVFTAVLLFAGFGVMLFLVAATSRSVLEGELHRLFGRVRRSRMIERMTGHAIVCGYGRMGRAVVDELREGRREVVVIERDPDRAREAEDAGVPTIVDDATSEGVLRTARIDQARGLVACLDDDAHNVYVVITARSLSPSVLIVARATEDEAFARIRRAGADRVVNPYRLGGLRLAHLVVKPAIVSFFDASLGGAELQLDQSSLTDDSPLVGQTVGEVDFRGRWDLSLVAVQRGNEVTPGPGADFRLASGDVLVVFGRRERISRFDDAAGSG